MSCISTAPPIPPRWIQSLYRSAWRFVATQYFGLETWGRRHIPAHGPAIIIGNHPTYLDPYTIGYGTERWITWMAWEEAFTWPAVGRVMRQMGAFPVSTLRPKPSTLRVAYNILKHDRLLGMFFEGARTATGDLLSRPRRGAAQIALRAGVPVVPVSVAGARRLWPLDATLPRPGKIVVRYHAPIDTESFERGAPARQRAEALTQKIAAAILSGLPPDGRHSTF